MQLKKNWNGKAMRFHGIFADRSSRNRLTMSAASPICLYYPWNCNGTNWNRNEKAQWYRPEKYHELASKLQTSEIPIDINQILASFTDIQLEYIEYHNRHTTGRQNDETYIFITVEKPNTKNASSCQKLSPFTTWAHRQIFKLYHRQANGHSYQ